MTSARPGSPILVTGAAGFIGSHLVDRLLADGAAVVGVDDLSTGRLANLEVASRHPSFSFVRLDVTSSDFRSQVVHARPGSIVHLAAQMDVRKSVADPLHDARVNVLGTINVLNAAADAGVGRVLFASSGGTVYGEPTTLPVPDDAPLRPSSPYGAAKVAGEVYVDTYRRLRGLSGTSLALANVYGPRQDPHGEAGVVSIFARALLTGAPTTIFGDGTSARDYVYVTDVVDAFVRCLTGTTCSRFNVGTGVATPVRALHDLLAGICGRDTRPTLAAPRLGELHVVSLDSRTLTDRTGWRPSVPLQEGLRRTVEWVRATLESQEQHPATRASRVMSGPSVGGPEHRAS